MNILLVYPSTLNESGRVVKHRMACLPPLGLAIIDALTPPQHSVTILYDMAEDVDVAVRWDLVAITAMTAQAERAYQLADGFRAHGTRVVLGGMHPSALPDEAQQHADVVVIGEVEDIWPEILADCESGKFKPRYQAPQMPDLQRLVIPRWSNANMRVYPRRVGARLPMMPIFTTRGCPMGCKFCAVSARFGKSYRTKPISHVLQEIEQTGADDYFFVDDNIACRPEYTRELFAAMQGKGIRWMSQISTTVLKQPDLIELAGKAGCYCLFVGFESLRSESLQEARKTFNNIDAYEELIRLMRAAGIVLMPSFMFGFDEDLPEDFEYTLSFLRRNRIGVAAFQLLTPMPGTVLFTETVEEQRLKSGGWSMYDGTHILRTTEGRDEDAFINEYWRTFQSVYSIPNILLTTFHDTLAAKNRRIETFWRTLFFKSLFRQKVSLREHPLAGGFR